LQNEYSLLKDAQDKEYDTNKDKMIEIKLDLDNKIKDVESLTNQIKI